jgi:hypothetical protein
MAADCTFSALAEAVTEGGVITFNCGAAPVTIPVTATLNLQTDRNTVIDGGNLITLDGGNSVQILRFDHADFMVNLNGITLQHITLVNGKTTPTQAIPSAPAPCSQGYDDGEGGAMYVRDGTVRIIDVTFENNQAALLGPDTGGGGVYILGSKPAFIVNSSFINNKASNGGGLGSLFVDLNVYNCLFEGNTATGNGANNNDASQCSAINNGQNEIGSGGNGGALYNDGASATNVTVCGTQITNNAAGTGAFGGGIFYTSNDFSGTLTITDSTITGNTGGSWGGAGTAVGVNAKAIVITNSTVQGYP